MSDTYKITRFYQRSTRSSRVIKTGLTLAEAQAHCKDPETSSATCTKKSNIARTCSSGPWFEGYDKE